MLFRKKVERSCVYCQYGTVLDEAQVLCTKKGVVSPEKACRKFTYDPLKRVPQKAKTLDFRKYDEEDFSL